MSVQTNISLSGLSIDSNDFLYCGEVNVTGSLTMEPGSTLTLQPNSVSDSYLSTNIALKNGNNIFTNTNDFTSSTTTAKTEATGDNSTKIATTAWVQNKGYAPLAGTSNIFTGSNTFQNQLTCSGIISDDLINIKRAPGSSFLSFQDITNLTTITFALANATASVFVAATSSIYNIIVRDASNITRTVLSLSYAQCTFTSSSPINTTATDPVVTDVTGKLATTRFVNSKQTNFLTLANTFTNQVTCSRTAGNVNLRCFDSSNSTATTFAQNNNQINIVLAQNDSKIYFNTLSSLGVQTDTLLLNTGTSTFNCTNPLVQTATMPSFSTSSNQTPTMAWTQGAISSGTSSLLASNNVFTGTNNFSVSYPTISVATLPSSDATTAISTNKWTQTVITALKAASTNWTGLNTFEKSGVDIPLAISSSSQPNYKGYQFISTAAGNYNSIVGANEYVVFGYNTTALDLSTLTLTTHSNTGSGIKISNNLVKVFGPNEFVQEIKTSTTDPPASQCLGHIFTVLNYILPSTFNFSTSWSGVAPNINLYSYNIDNSTANKKFGTYMIQAQLVYANSGPTKDFLANINFISASTDISPFMTVCGSSNCQPYGGSYYYTMYICVTRQIYTNTNIYLNCKLNSTGGTGDWTGDSFFQLTRIA